MTETRTERMIIRRYLENEKGLDAHQRERIAACYLEHQSAEAAAGEAHLSPLTTRMIYYRLAMALVHSALTGVMST